MTNHQEIKLCFFSLYFFFPGSMKGAKPTSLGKILPFKVQREVPSKIFSFLTFFPKMSSLKVFTKCP